MLNWRQNTKNLKVELFSAVIMWKTILVLRNIHRARIISISNDGRQSHGYHLQTARLRWTGSRRNVSLYPDRNGICSKIIENYKIGMSRHLDSFATTPQIMVKYWRPSCSSWAKSVRSSFGRTVMGKAFWENPVETGLGENSKLGMSLCTSWKRIILICVCGWHKIGWKETKHWSDVENTQQRSRLGRTNIFLGSCILGLHSKTMPNEQRYCRQLQNHVWIANFRGENSKKYHVLKIFVFLHGLMTWLVMQRNVWSDIVSWQTRRLSNSTKYLLHASMSTTSKEEETKSVREM